MQPKINVYDFGYIDVDGVEYSRDIVISPTKGVVANWWRREGHRISIEDVKDYLFEPVDLVIFGVGFYGMVKVDEDVIEFYRSKNIDVVIKDSMKAVEEYNKAIEAGKRVLLFIHLTC